MAGRFEVMVAVLDLATPADALLFDVEESVLRPAPDHLSTWLFRERHLQLPDPGGLPGELAVGVRQVGLHSESRLTVGPRVRHDTAIS